MIQHISIHLLLLSQIVTANLPILGKGVDFVVQRIYSNKVGRTGREETENEDFSLREKGDGMLIQKANGPPPPLLLHPRCILSWTSHNLSKQLLFDSGWSSPGRFFLSSGSGPWGSGWRHAARDKLQYSGYLKADRRRRGRYFFLVDLRRGQRVATCG